MEETVVRRDHGNIEKIIITKFSFCDAKIQIILKLQHEQHVRKFQFCVKFSKKLLFTYNGNTYVILLKQKFYKVKENF